jgi:hypothetical protein
MIDAPKLSRRWFIFGSAAAVASTALPRLAEPVLFARSARQIPVRKVYGVLFEPNGEGDAPVTIELTRNGIGRPLLTARISPRGAFHWRALEFGEIILPESHRLHIAAAPDPGPDALLQINYLDRQGDAFAELFEWRNGVAVATQYLQMAA